MKAIKTIILVVFILMGSVAAFAQNEGGPSDRRRQIEAQKIAFITSELELTPEEAQVFWPVYNQAKAERKTLRKAHREMRHGKAEEGAPKKTLDSMTDKELEEKMDAMIAHEQAELDLRKKYLAKYKEVLPMHKVAKLYQAERKFKKKLMANIKGRRAGVQGEQMRHKRPSQDGH